MNIATVKIADFDELYSLWNTAGLTLYPKEQEMKRFLDMISLNPDFCMLMVDDAHRIIGSIMGAFDGRTASIHRLAIHPDYQKKGYGTKLIDELYKKLKEKGIMKLSAQIHISNMKVIDFYKKLGFKEMDYVVTFFKDLE